MGKKKYGIIKDCPYILRASWYSVLKNLSISDVKILCFPSSRYIDGYCPTHEMRISNFLALKTFFFIKKKFFFAMLVFLETGIKMFYNPYLIGLTRKFKNRIKTLMITMCSSRVYIRPLTTQDNT